MIEICPCRAEDFANVLALLRQLWPGRRLDEAALRPIYNRALVSDRELYLCALSGQQMVGFGSLALKNNLWSPAPLGYINELVVDDSRRSGGIGTQLLDELMARARALGCDRVELDSDLQRKRAHAFYECRGFQNRAHLYAKSL